MSHPTASLITVLISVGIAVPLTLVLQRTPDVILQEGAAPVVDPARLAQLEKRVAELGEQGQALRVPIDANVTADRGDQPSNSDRIGALERRVAALEQAQARSPANPVAPRPPAELNLQAQLRLAREQGSRRVLDPKATDKDKVKAHEALRYVPDAYTPAMVQELVRIGNSHPDADTRADVWRFFDGRSHIPTLVPHLLQALVQDASEKVRDEASETLGNYLKDPTVLLALRYAAENDASMRVRRKAIRTLRQNNLADAKRK